MKGVMLAGLDETEPIMAPIKIMTLISAALLVGAPASPHQPYSIGPQSQSEWPTTQTELSILSYNVRGLPWPAALDRADSLHAIAERLALMRQRGIQPHVVLLQEAFTDDAKAIGALSGFEYVVRGPSSRAHPKIPPLGPEFAKSAQWIKGETSDPRVDSGLLILSDFPVKKVHAMAFPDGACAGFDCLATKGVVVAWVEVPGLDAPLAIANAHLNSRHATHVSPLRADRAFAWQSLATRDFIHSEVRDDEPIIFGGDFNAGGTPARREAFAENPPLGSRQQDGLVIALQDDLMLAGSRKMAVDILHRNLDKMLYRSGSKTEITPAQAWVPFGREAHGPPMSDHTGFVVSFALSQEAHE